MPLIQKSYCGQIPCRFIICFMLYLAATVSYILRTTMCIAIIAMTKPNGNSSSIDLDENDKNPKYNWSTNEEGLVLGAFFWGYIVIMIPSGLLVEWYGSRIVFGTSIGLSGILTFLCPFLANDNCWPLFFAQCGIGLFSGCLYPMIHNLISHWAPTEEKSIFSASQMAISLGSVITFVMSGLIINSIGWPYIFYISSVISLIFTILWFCLVFDSPKKHPWISVAEREFIESRILSNDAKTKVWPPYCQIFQSIPFWALNILHYGSTWGIFFLLTCVPKYFNEVLGYEASVTGWLAIIPHLMMFIFSIGSGLIADIILKKNWLSVTLIRKIFCLASHVIPALFLFGITFVDHQQQLCVLLISMALGFFGIISITNLQNAQDLAPNFAASLFSIINCIACTTGFITPLVLAYYTKENNTAQAWNYMFMISGILLIFTTTVYILFGSAKVQPWNDVVKLNINLNKINS